MVGPLTLAAMAMSSLGWGVALLRIIPSPAMLTHLERSVWAMILGMGLSGWLMFPAALALGANTSAAMTVTGGGFALLVLFGQSMWLRSAEPGQGTANAATWVLMAVVALFLSMDLAAAIIPPVDADSMAYHFALPKRFLAQGSISFAPQAVEAAIPLLFHMTYMQALALGGEFGLTLWCGASAWLLPLGLFATARRYLSLNQALFLMVAIKSLPAMVYGSPSGQIEVRLAALFLVAAFLTARARQEASWRMALIAGIAAGFCAGAKYSGAVAPVVCGLALLGDRGRLPSMVAFGLGALAAGAQWYGWNWLHTGDPLFPMLWGVVPYSSDAFWNEDMQRAFRDYIGTEQGVPKSILWLFYYPLKATFDSLPIFESGRTGFGPLIFILLPFAVAGMMTRRSRIGTHELTIVTAICLLGYALWFMGGSSQRVRHFLPELAPLLLCMAVAATAACRRVPAVSAPLAAGLGLALLIQTGGMLVFSSYTLKYLTSGGNRETYLEHNISAYPLVKWLNTHLNRDQKVLLSNRELIYLLDVPAFYLSSSYDGRIRLTPPMPTLDEYLGQLWAQGVTHIVVGNLPQALISPRSEGSSLLENATAALIAVGCAEVIGKVTTPPLLQSRTLRLTATTQNETHLIIALRPESCRAGAS